MTKPLYSSPVLVVGSTSGIARSICRVWAGNAKAIGRRAALVLAARDADELSRQADDLRTRFGCDVRTLAYDAADLDAAGALIAAADSTDPADSADSAASGRLGGVILAHGWLPDADASRQDPATIRRLVDVNYTSMVLLLEEAAALFEQRRAGFICALSSVAGDRGRRPNYPYGATKAGLSAYLQGLRSRLQPAGVPVLTVKPGFVDTAMVWGVVKPNSPLNASPERVGKSIVRAIHHRRNVIYTPWFWRIIMGIIRSIPEFVFKRMKV